MVKEGLVTNIVKIVILHLKKYHFYVDCFEICKF
jgi:hypothetical protein